ncbi:MAG: ABC transporter permease [Caldilineaceae bacterium]
MAIAQPTVSRSTAPSRLQSWWKSLSIVFESRVATVGLCLVLFWFIVGFISIFWTPHSTTANDFQPNLPPSSVNWLGTDHLGRDTASRLMAGTQVVLLKTRLPEFVSSRIGLPIIPGGVALWGVFGALLFGAILGLNAGYRGGWWDQAIMQVLDALIAFPVIVLYLVIVSAFGHSDLVVILAITITGTPGIARLIRSMTLDLKTRDYIRAAETRGEGKNWIMFREILPNALGPLLVDAMLRIGYAIFAIGTLGFLGIGLPPPEPDWGSMVNDARGDIFKYQLPVIWPALSIATLVIGLNLLADGLREEITRYQK